MIGDNVDELKVAQDTLVAFQARLVEAEKLSSLGQLAAGLAHEINNPLGYISNNLVILGQYARKIEELLQTYAELEAAVRCLQEVQSTDILPILEAMKKEIGSEAVLSEFYQVLAETREGVDRVKKIVVDLKAFARVGQENLECTDVHVVLDSALNIIHHEVKYGIIVMQERGEVPHIMCYPRQLGQVFINILMNAVQAVDPRQGCIHVRTFTRDGRVVVEFEDNGGGIAPAILPRIFEPFFTTKDVGTGTGLGLSTAYGIVRKHGGEIATRRAPGGGSIFSVSLPADGTKQS